MLWPVLLLAAAGLLASCGRERALAVPMSHRSPPGGPTAETEIFAVVKPGATPREVLVARAARHQPGGPETLVPVKVQPCGSLPLAPGALIRITAPLYNGDLDDWISGAAVTPERFASLARLAESRYGPLPDRARMFHVTLDGQGRVSRMRHIFSP